MDLPNGETRLGLKRKGNFLGEGPTIAKRGAFMKRMYARATIATDIGDKTTNEDRFAVQIMREVPRFKSGSVFLYGLFDGHAGCFAVDYTKKHLLDKIASKLASSTEGSSMRKILSDSFTEIQEDMKKESAKWPTNPVSGNPSTAGTTATVLLIAGDTIYVAHVGDTSVLYAHKEGDGAVFSRLTKLHKPDDPDEADAVAKRGGVIKSNRVCRDISCPETKVVENRPCLAMTRALGNYWSYTSTTGDYKVSPVPDVLAAKLRKDCYLLMATDGVTDVMSDRLIMKKFIALDKFERDRKPTTIEMETKTPMKVQFAREIITEAKSMYNKTSKMDNMTVVAVKVSFVHPEDL